MNEDFQVGHTSNITCIAEYSAPPAGKLSATHAPSMRVFIEDLNPLVLAEEYVVLRTAYNEDIYILQQVRNMGCHWISAGYCGLGFIVDKLQNKNKNKNKTFI